MTTKLFVKVAAISMLFISLGLQAMALLSVAYDLITIGAFGAGSAISYGGSQPFSIPAFIVAIALIYVARIRFPMKWIYGSYFGSHLIVWICILAFPGRFYP
jgi:hypothetical protein